MIRRSTPKILFSTPKTRPVRRIPAIIRVQYSGNIGGPLSKKASFFFTEDIRDIHDLGIVNAQIVDPTTFAVDTI